MDDKVSILISVSVGTALDWEGEFEVDVAEEVWIWRMGSLLSSVWEWVDPETSLVNVVLEHSENDNDVFLHIGIASNPLVVPLQSISSHAHWGSALFCSRTQLGLICELGLIPPIDFHGATPPDTSVAKSKADESDHR